MNKFFLILIFVLGFFLRLYNLGGVPVGFHRDEAFLGYNAYSILKTGKDMTGDVLPIHFKSFIYSPAGYSYFSIPAIALFGLNEFSVRLPSAIFGSLTVLVIYFLVIQLFKNRSLGLLSSLFFAISPWSINLSRVATENVLVVFFMLLGVLFYLKWVARKNYWLLIISFICFGLTLILYQAPRAFLPIFLPFLYLLVHPIVKKNYKSQILPILLFIVIIIFPLCTIFMSSNLSQRISMLSIFKNPETQLVLDEQIREDEGNGVMITRIFHNKIINYSITFFENYFNHFSYNFLFSDKGYPDRYRVPSMGLLYFFDLPFIIYGFWKLFSNDSKNGLLLLGWVLITPIGSALTYDDIPNLQRTLIMVPALSIISAYGLFQIWKELNKNKFLKLVNGAILLFILYGIGYYLHQYYVHQVNHRPWFREEGYRQLVKKVNVLQNEFDKVVVSDTESNPAIFFLFYNKYDPRIIQKQLQLKPTHSYGHISFSKYQFPEQACPLQYLPQENLVEKPMLSGEKNVLYINNGNCKLKDSRVQDLYEIKRSDNTVVFILQKVK